MPPFLFIFGVLALGCSVWAFRHWVRFLRDSRGDSSTLAKLKAEFEERIIDAEHLAYDGLAKGKSALQELEARVESFALKKDLKDITDKVTLLTNTQALSKRF